MFKVGDKVECIDVGSNVYITIGKQYKVLRFYDISKRISIISDYNRVCGYDSYHFKLKEEGMFKTGDIIINGDGNKDTAKVLFANEFIFIKSFWGNYNLSHSTIFTHKEAKDNGLKLYTPDSDLVKVTCEGKDVEISRKSAEALHLI